MDQEINEVVIQYLREHYQTRDDIGDHPITTEDIISELNGAGFGQLSIYDANRYLKRVGFVGVTIPGDADMIWKIRASSF